MIFYIDKYFSLEIICDIKNAANFKQNIKYQALFYKKITKELIMYYV